MTTQLEVFNQALGLLSQPVIAATDAVDETTRALNRHWVASVETCLEQGEWDFAMKRTQLAQVSPAPEFGWEFYYGIPADCLRIIWLAPTSNPRDRASPDTYQIESGQIATSFSAVYVRYVSSDAVGTPGRWTQSFARFAAAELAKRCIKINNSALEAVTKELANFEKKSLGIDAAQGPPRSRRHGTWSTANRRHSRLGNPGTGIPEQS